MSEKLKRHRCGTCSCWRNENGDWHRLDGPARLNVNDFGRATMKQYYINGKETPELETFIEETRLGKKKHKRWPAIYKVLLRLKI